MSDAPSPLWVPSAARVQQSQLTAFTEQLRERTGEALHDYEALHRFSIDQAEVFWDAVWAFAGIITHEPYGAVRGPVRMPGTSEATTSI